jgi:hypothetical protein
MECPRLRGGHAHVCDLDGEPGDRPAGATAVLVNGTARSRHMHIRLCTEAGLTEYAKRRANATDLHTLPSPGSTGAGAAWLVPRCPAWNKRCPAITSRLTLRRPARIGRRPYFREAAILGGEGILRTGPSGVAGESGPVGDGRGFGAAGGVELGQDVRHVDADGLGRDEQVGRDVAVAAACGDQAQHLGLARG